MRSGETVLRCERVVVGGDALARDAEGRVVFVPGALPGEAVRVRLVERRADYARAQLVEVLEASADRVAPPCPHVARGCGGCGWQHVHPDAQRRLKAAVVTDALQRLGGLTDPPVAETAALPTAGYRTTVRMAVERDGRLAFRRVRAHELVAVDACLVAHPLLAPLIAEGRFPGVSEVTLRCGAATGERLVWAEPSGLGVAVPPLDHTVVAAPDRPPGPAAAYHEVVAGHRFRVSALSFFQPSLVGAEALVELVTAAVAGLEPARAADLYAGVGLFAAALATAGWSVIAVESSPSAAADARHNLAGLPARVVRADVRRWRPHRVQLVVADPPRAGLGRAGVATVVTCRPERLVLVSCDPASLGRDASLLAAAGYQLERATPVDLFPHTPHVEVVSVFAPAPSLTALDPSHRAAGSSTPAARRRRQAGRPPGKTR